MTTELAEMSATERLQERNSHSLELHLAEQRALKRLHITQNSIRPDSTKKTYSGKILEFIEWMKTKGYPDEQVTEQKMVYFLTEMQDRPARKRGRKRKDCGNAEEDDKNRDKVGHSLLAAYVNAMMDEWRLQYSLQSNPRVPIRPDSVKKLLNQKKIEIVSISEKTYVDAGIVTMADAIVNETTLKKIVDTMLKDPTETGLKHRADLLLSVSLSSRGDNIRRLRLPNIGLIVFPDEGVNGANLLRTVWRKSKRNQYGNVEETTLMRHKHPELCAMGALAMYFFYRWHVGDEPWPDFSKRQNWYDIYVIKGASPVDESRYPQHYIAIKQVYELLGVQSTVKTQLGRKHASQAENKGASAASVDRQGHWATKSRVGAYANHSIPFDCVRVLAGFGPEPDRYYINRNIIIPPESLQNAIFPQLEQSRQAIKASGSEIAGTSFLKLISYMRIVLLQDVALLIELGYNHPVLQHEIFQSQEYVCFRDQLLANIASTPRPQSVIIQQALPIVAEDLCELRSQVSHVRSDMNNLTSSIQSMASAIQNNASRLHDQVLERIGNALVIAGTSLHKSPLNNLNIRPLSDDICQNVIQEAGNVLNVSSNQNTTLICPEKSMMSRQLTSVEQVWREYTIGFPPNPPLKALETRFGASWRKSNSETQFFIRRKPIYDAINAIIAEGVSQDECIKTLNLFKGNKSLRQLSDKLKIMLRISSNTPLFTQIKCLI